MKEPTQIVRRMSQADIDRQLTAQHPIPGDHQPSEINRIYQAALRWIRATRHQQERADA